MVEQVEHLKDKYENLEARRKNESQGYQVPTLQKVTNICSYK
jgi:hypothetical protein